MRRVQRRDAGDDASRACALLLSRRVVCAPAQVRRLVDDRIYVMKTINIEGMSVKEQEDAIKEVRGGGGVGMVAHGCSLT